MKSWDDGVLFFNLTVRYFDLFSQFLILLIGISVR